MSRWVQVSEQLYVASSTYIKESSGEETARLRDSLSTVLKPGVEISTLKYNDVTYVCNSTNSTEDCLPVCPEVPSKLGMQV